MASNRVKAKQREEARRKINRLFAEPRVADLWIAFLDVLDRRKDANGITLVTILALVRAVLDDAPSSVRKLSAQIVREGQTAKGQVLMRRLCENVSVPMEPQHNEDMVH